MLINVYATVCQLPPLTFPCQLLGQRDRSDPELLSHLEGFAGYVHSLGKGQMTQSIYYTIKHIQRVRHHLSLEVAEAQMDAFSDWACAANGLCFMTDGSVCNPLGQVVLPEADVAVALPYPDAAIARKAKVDAQLAALGIHVPASLPPVFAESELELRSAADCAQRVLALFVSALRGESLASGHPIPVADLQAKLPLAFAGLSPQEQAFLQNPQPSEQEAINFAWRYECIALLLWGLGQMPELPRATQICDVSAVAEFLLAQDLDQFVATATLRPATEILDALDWHYRLQWAAHEARQTSSELAADFDAGVIQERLYALNWLTHTDPGEWDEIDTPA